jgi:carbon storage regulator
MLVVRRRPGESLMIGDDVEIEFLESTHSYIKIGIHAPKDVVVLRKELYLTRKQNWAASRRISEDAVGSVLAKRTPRP